MVSSGREQRRCSAAAAAGANAPARTSARMSTKSLSACRARPTRPIGTSVDLPEEPCVAQDRQLSGLPRRGAVLDQRNAVCLPHWPSVTMHSLCD